MLGIRRIYQPLAEKQCQHSPGIERGSGFLLGCILLLCAWMGLTEPLSAQGSTERQLGTDAAETFYVATTGDDQNPGTEAAPLRHIQTAVNLAGPGDTIFVRAGVYHEAVTMTNSGTADAPIVLTAYPGEQPVIDGDYVLPSGEPARWNYEADPPIYFVWGALVRIRGSHIEFSGFEVKHSLGRAIVVSHTPEERNHNVVIRDCLVHDSRNSLVRVMDADHVLIENCNFYHASDYATHSRTAPQLNWPAALATVNATHVTIRHNAVHENWSSGISPGVDSRHITIENNVIYDHLGQQLYVHRSEEVTIRNNLIYHSNHPDFLRGGDPSSCIAMNNETGFETAMTVNGVVVKNNIIVGCRRNIGIWRSEGTGMMIQNVRIVNNTLVNATANRDDFENAGIFIAPGNFRNITLKENLILQNDGISGDGPQDDNIRISRNLWSREPVTALRAPDDIIAPPQLVNPTAELLPGQVDPLWYVPVPDSIAIREQVGAIAFSSNKPPALPDFPAAPVVVKPTDRGSQDLPIVGPQLQSDMEFIAPGLIASWRDSQLSKTDAANTNVVAAANRVAHSSTPATANTDENESTGPQVLYRFDEGEGAIVRDSAGIEPPLDLVIDDEGAITWGDGSLTVNSPTLLTTQARTTRLTEACIATGELTIEAWIEPANVTQDGPARILTMSRNPRLRNFMLGQGLWDEQATDLFTARLRTTEQSLNGEPPLSTASGTAQVEMTHLVFTHAATGESSLYLYGELRNTSGMEGSFDNWDRNYTIVLANEAGGERPWLGTYAMVAIYCHALTAEEVATQYAAGPQ